ncbi:MAG TPA: protein-L-isoaspartate(D-aspartate) O-methyltransferase [Candidatus Limnocylindria bacterium]|nr:protein-L-isoaspartate(D-aspartate) O-methyltransferase [Candidatus Limnocylindria bacterium]
MRWPRLSRRRERPRTPDDDRRRMVAEQLESRGIRDPEVLEAFRTVPRHRFVEGDEPYGDHAMPVGSGQTISQPYVVARMTQAARPKGQQGWRGANVLEVGTGSGYQAAILAQLGARVTSIERHAELAAEAQRKLADAGYDKVRVEVGDGTQGWPEGGPYRSILVTAGGPSVPKPLLEQLDADGGRLIMPVGDRQHQFLTLVVRHGSDLQTTELEPVVFVPLIGRHGLEE